MRTPYSSSFLQISSPTTLFFLPSLKMIYYKQFNKSVEERNIADFNKTQSLISETLSRPLYAMLVYFAKNVDSLLPDSQVITHQITEDVKLANLIRYSSFNANLKDFTTSLKNTLLDNPAQMFKFVEARNISHSAIIELILKLCSCISNKQMRSSKFSTSAHYAVENIFELLSVEDMFNSYTENEHILDDDVLRCRKYIASFFKNFNVDDYLNYRPILAHEFYNALIDICTSKLTKCVNISDVVMKSVKQHLDMLSQAFFILSSHTYLDCKNMSPTELKLNRVVACADYEFSDLICMCSENAQCEIMNENYLLEHQIKRQNSHIELLQRNTRNFAHRELTDEELAHERLEYIISNFPLNYYDALDDILDIIYDKFASSEFFTTLIKKFDRVSINHDQRPMYSMHHNVVHCEFESCKNCYKERLYSDNCNKQHDTLNDIESLTSEKLDEPLKVCDIAENEQTHVNTDDVKSDSNTELDNALELIGIKLKAKPKEYIDNLMSEVKSMLENKIDIEKWLNDDAISMEKKLEIGYIIKVIADDIGHKS